jgi:peptidyl-prolyl cis-trans isomerase B (cyclophilin B)
MMMRSVISIMVFLTAAAVAYAQAPAATPPKELPKINARPTASPQRSVEPFDNADVKTMAAQCVTLDTEAGLIYAEMYPESAPESVRNFLNLAAIGAFDNTTFSRIVPDFVIQGGDLYTSGKITPELAVRARRTVPDEPNKILHERGVLSMARSEKPNSATTNFFILVEAAPHLDGSFAAFGRVLKGMDAVDAINKAAAENEKPLKPVKIKKATIAQCAEAGKLPAFN